MWYRRLNNSSVFAHFVLDYLINIEKNNNRIEQLDHANHRRMRVAELFPRWTDRVHARARVMLCRLQRMADVPVLGHIPTQWAMYKQ